MTQEYKDTDLREALRRKYANSPKLPADFMDGMMKRMEPQPVAKKRTRWRWAAAAACLLLVAGIGLTLLPHEEQNGTDLMAKTDPPTTADGTAAQQYAAQQNAGPENAAGQNAAAENAGPENTAQQNAAPENAVSAGVGSPYPAAVQPAPGNNQPVPEPRGKTARSTTASEPRGKTTRTPTAVAPLADPNVHYAAYTATDDTVAYQAPSRVDEFIAKLATYHQVDAEALNCATGASDTTIVTRAYLFEDSKELDLFARLLQVACWYHSKTPGYLLNFSHKQFVFCLQDPRKGLKYLWVAERIGGNHILLFATHSPIDANVSSTCFQEYREQLTNKGLNTRPF